MSTSSVTAAPSFNGQSQFASSLSQVIARAVAIASLPEQAYQATLNNLTSQQNALAGLNYNFASLQSSVASLQQAVAAGSLTSSVSDGSIVQATVGSSASPGTYSIEVTSLGSATSALSVAGNTAVSDPTTQGITSSATLTLNVNGTLTTITPASTSLQDLANAINSQAGGQVTATLVNVGSTSAPDYRLSLQAVKLGTGAIDLTDSNSTDLISSSTPGALASYKVAGLSIPITSDTRTVTLAPGLTVNLLNQSATGVATTINVKHDSSPILSAFQSIAANYNAAFDALALYHGQNAGVLEGDSIVRDLNSLLQQLSGYGSGNPSTALANFGITVGTNGHLIVDSTAFTNAANANFAGLTSILGTSTTGGFLQTATNLLAGVEDPISGTLITDLSNIAGRISSQNTLISNQQTKLTQLQNSLTQQMAAADAAISALESRVSYVNGLFYSITGNNNNPNASSPAA